MLLLCAQVWSQTFPEYVPAGLSTKQPGLFLWLLVVVVVFFFVLECSQTLIWLLVECRIELKKQKSRKRAALKLLVVVATVATS